MEWLKTILEQVVYVDGKVDIEATMKLVNTEFPKHAVPKTTFNDINGQLKAANETITTLKEENAENEKLQATITKLETDMKAQQDDYAAKEADRTFMETLSSTIKELGGKNATAVTALLKLDELKGSKNQTEDIKKALESVKESDAYLFGDNEPINNPVGSVGGGAGVDSSTAMMRAAMGLPAETSK